jgi:hypothetical protein
MSRLVQLASVDVSEPEILHVTTTGGNHVEVLGADFDRQLARWESIHRLCAARQFNYPWLDLSPTNNLPLRVVPLAAATP